MRIVMFYHSLLSDWNHGNAHFLRGIASEFLDRGHEVHIYEPRGGWSLENLIAEHGQKPLRKFRATFPRLDSTRYDLSELDLSQAVDGADLVLVHEWNDEALVHRIGEHRKHTGNYVLFFHDTHHRMVTAPQAMARYDLSGYDGVLAYGKVLRDLYIQRGISRAWTWHEGADIRIFRPLYELVGRTSLSAGERGILPREGTGQDAPATGRLEAYPATPAVHGPNAFHAKRLSGNSHSHGEFMGDLVWIGNWGDGERASELREFLIEPVKHLGLKARVYGVRYPEEARRALSEAGIEYSGWLPNFEVPRVFSEFRLTVHVPRRPYLEALPGIPTIRPFEALACGIPLISSPWNDTERLFNSGQDFVMASNGTEMTEHLDRLLHDAQARRALACHGLDTILARHTCAHRVDELFDIYDQVRRSTGERRTAR